MKFVKGISLYFIYPVLMLGLGFYAGVKATHFFYPGEQRLYYQLEQEHTEQPSQQEGSGEEPKDYGDYSLAQEADEGEEELVLEAASSSETLSVETEYVLEERDIDGHTTVETTWKLPDKYVGMDREQFLEAMEFYEAFPPLSEMERGFVSLEVLSFSRERVVVQMNYRYVKPSSSFYLAAYDNEVLVYLEDKETVYIETDIMLEELSDELQKEVIDMMWIENEEELYDFLEAYSS